MAGFEKLMPSNYRALKILSIAGNNRLVKSGVIAGKVLRGVAGQTGPVADAVSTIQDMNDFHHGDIGLSRLGYRLSTRSIGLATSMSVAGPERAVAGFIIGLAADGAETFYDNIFVPSYERTSYEIGRFESSLHSWIPR